MAVHDQDKKGRPVPLWAWAVMVTLAAVALVSLGLWVEAQRVPVAALRAAAVDFALLVGGAVIFVSFIRGFERFDRRREEVHRNAWDSLRRHQAEADAAPDYHVRSA